MEIFTNFKCEQECDMTRSYMCDVSPVSDWIATVVDCSWRCAGSTFGCRNLLAFLRLAGSIVPLFWSVCFPFPSVFYYNTVSFSSLRFIYCKVTWMVRYMDFRVLYIALHLIASHLSGSELLCSSRLLFCLFFQTLTIASILYQCTATSTTTPKCISVQKNSFHIRQ